LFFADIKYRGDPRFKAGVEAEFNRMIDGMVMGEFEGQTARLSQMQ